MTTETREEVKMTSKPSGLQSIGKLLLSAAMALGVSAPAAMAQPKEVKVGLLVPLSGIYARPGAVMRMGAEMGVEHINAQGGIKSLGGAKLKLVVLDSGDSTEKAKSAAQRMVAQETDLVVATGAYLSSFTLAVTEVTERANLPMLTLSYSDMITERGFKYIFQTSATSGSQAASSSRRSTPAASSRSGRPSMSATASGSRTSSTGPNWD
jgi:branched-chain amino acid transport system substrate-binding protein